MVYIIWDVLINHTVKVLNNVSDKAAIYGKGITVDVFGGKRDCDLKNG